MGKDVNKQWVEEILNPDTVRTKFVMMGLFMVAHELLEDSIKSTPLSFFADKWKDGKPIQSEDYKAEVLALDRKGKNDVQRGSIEWLKKMSAIDDTDARSIREVTDERNDFAHEMRHIVSGWARMPDLEKYFPKILDLHTKLERWRLVAIETPVLSDSDGRIPDIHGIHHNLDNLDEDEPISESVVAMRILCQVALGNHDEAWLLHHHFSGLGRA